MDEESVKEAAENHAAATVDGDLDTAGSYLTSEGRANVRSVMGAMPDTLERHEIANVEQTGDDFIVNIRYSGGDKDVTVESTWADREGRPRIVNLRLL
jgi:hypothetical protein